MADLEESQITFEYRDPENIKSKVPGLQQLRESVDASELAIAKSTEFPGVTIDNPDDYILSPVIKVTKHEATFIKGDLKLQKVSVNENVSMNYQHLFKKETLPGQTVVTRIEKCVYKKGAK